MAKKLLLFGGLTKAWTYDFDGSRFGHAANNTIHDVAAQDVAMWAWVKANPLAGNIIILDKRVDSNTGYAFGMVNNVLWAKIGDGTDTYIITGNSDFRDGEWHFVACIFDKSNAANCKIFEGGSEDGTTGKAGNLATVGSLTNAGIMHLGANIADGGIWDGVIGQVGVCYPNDVMAAGEFGAANEQAAVMNAFQDRSAWSEREESWLINEGSGLVLYGENEDITLTSAAGWITAQRP